MRIRTRAIGLMALILLLRAGFARAQEGATAAELASLGRVVTLDDGVFTLRDAMKALSTQSGLRISTEPYLEQRKVMLCLHGLSASAVLDTLAEIHALTWRKTSENSFLLTRKTVRGRGLNQTLAAGIRACLPLDLSVYMGFGPAYESATDLARREMRRNVNDHGNKLGNLQDTFVAGFGPALAVKELLEYTRLPDEQKTLLLYCLFFENVREARELLRDEQSPSQMEPTRASLNLAGDVLMVKTPLGNSTMGFGKNVIKP